MGFFSDIVDAIKDVFKFVKEKIFKPITKAVSKVFGSDLGKALLIGAAVWLGGAALGAWSSPFQSINGVLASGAGETAAANVVGSAASTAAGTGVEVAAATAPGTITGGIVGGTGAASEAAAVTGLMESAAAGTTANAALPSTISSAVKGAAIGNTMAQPTAQAMLAPAAEAAGTAAASTASQAAAPSLLETIKGAAGRTINWFGENPVATLLAGQTMMSAFTPSEAENYEEMMKIKQDNSTFAGVGYDGSGPGLDLSRLAPNPNIPERPVRQQDPQQGPMSTIFRGGRVF